MRVLAWRGEDVDGVLPCAVGDDQPLMVGEDDRGLLGGGPLHAVILAVVIGDTGRCERGGGAVRARRRARRRTRSPQARRWRAGHLPANRACRPLWEPWRG